MWEGATVCMSIVSTEIPPERKSREPSQKNTWKATSSTTNLLVRHYKNAKLSVFFGCVNYYQLGVFHNIVIACVMNVCIYLLTWSDLS